MASEDRKACQHPNQDQTSMEFDGDGMYRRLKCLECGDEITEYYERINVYNETKGEEEEEEIVKVRGKVPQKFFDWFQKQIYKDDGTDIDWMKKVDIYEEEEEEILEEHLKHDAFKESYEEREHD